MAEGVRINHPTIRSETIALHHDPTTVGKDHRGELNRNRRAKTYYINVDSNGDALVSHTVWIRIQEAQSRSNVAAGQHFTLQNTVSEPPPITFGTPGPGQEMFVPKTTLLDAFGDRDVTDERHAEVKKIAQGLAPKGTIARVTVREQVPLATPRGQNPDSV